MEIFPYQLSSQERRLLADILNMDPAQLSNPVLIPENQEKLWENKRRLLQEGYPLDYLLQEIRILGKRFHLNPHVLIPRPETEELIALLQSQYGDETDAMLVDMGCGSGFIGICLAELFSKTILVDLSPQALEVARRNVERNNLLNIECIESDLFKSPALVSILHERSWVLVANLPYVPIADKAQARENRIEFEPEIALYAGEDGLSVFYQLVKQLKLLPKPDAIYLELDPRNIQKAQEYLSRIYPETMIWEDYSGRKRLLVGKFDKFS